MKRPVFHTLSTLCRASLLIALVIPAALADAQQRLAHEGLPQRGWVEEATAGDAFVASADLWSALWSRFDDRENQLGLEGIISAALRGETGPETFIQLRSELIVPLMFALDSEPTRTEQWWQGQHRFVGGLGVGAIDGAGLQLGLDAQFLHTQEASGLGLSLAVAPVDIDEEIVALTLRPRFAPWNAEGATWHLGVPVTYRFRRLAYGSTLNPIDVRADHQVSLALDARSVGQGDYEGRVEAVRAAWTAIGVDPSNNGDIIGLTGSQDIGRLDLEALGTDLMIRADDGVLWRARFAAGAVGLFNSTEDTTDWFYSARIGGSVAQLERFQIEIFLRVADAMVAPDPRVNFNGSRAELAIRLDPAWFGTGFTQRSIADLACDLDQGLCYDGDAHRVHLLNEVFWPIAGGQLGLLYRAHHDARSLEGYDWSLATQDGDWIHEFGVFWRLNFSYEPLNTSALTAASPTPPAPSAPEDDASE